MSGVPLAEFHKRSGYEAPIPLSSKMMAAALTVGVYALIAVMTSQHGTYTPPRRPQMSQVVGAMPPVIAPVTAPEKTAQKPSRLSWFLAEPPASAAPASPSGNGPTIGFTFRDGPGGSTRIAGGCYDAAWAKAVSEKVRARFHHPAEKRHVSGLAFVRFVARRDGKLEQLEIVKSSGDKILDDAAYAMVHDAQPLPRIPRWMQVERVYAVLPIAFGDMAGKFKPAEGNCAPDPVLDRET